MAVSAFGLFYFAELADLVADVIESNGYYSGTIRGGQKVNGCYHSQDKGSDDDCIFDSCCSFSVEKQLQCLVSCCLIEIHGGVLFKCILSLALALETGDNFGSAIW